MWQQNCKIKIKIHSNVPVLVVEGGIALNAVRVRLVADDLVVRQLQRSLQRVSIRDFSILAFN